MHSCCVFDNHVKEVNCCAFSSSYFVTASGDKSVRVYSAQSFNEMSYSPINAFKYGVNYVSFNADENLLAAAVSDGKVYLIRLEALNHKVVSSFQHSNGTPAQVCSFSYNSSLLVSGSSDGSIAIWDIATNKLIRKVEGHPDGNVNAAAFTPCDCFLFTGSSLGDLRVWDLTTFQAVVQTQAHDGDLSSCGVTCIKISLFYHGHSSVANPNRSYLVASSGQDGAVRLWFFDISNKSLSLYRVLSGHRGPVNSCSFSNGGKFIASGSSDKRVIIWDTTCGTQELELLAHNSIVTSVAYSREGLLASSSFDKTSIIWKPGPRVSEVKYIRNEAGPSIARGGAHHHVDSSSSKLSLNFAQWSCDDVTAWLTDSVALGQYADAFKRNAIDGRELISLTSDSLKADLGIDALGHRNKILRAIQNLQNR